ncbi:MAG: amidohydrolase family protein [Pyrinomonadaceae bacterium]
MNSFDSTQPGKQPRKIYCARWVLPVTKPAIEDGAVAIDGASIVGVGTRGELAAEFPEAAQADFGEAAIMPGLVNCHSHLELTAMRGLLEDVEGDFYAWLRKLTIARAERMTADDLRVSATWGAVEAARAGVTCLGDASSAGETSMTALLEVGLRGIVYQEVISPDAQAAHEKLAQLREEVARLRERETALVRVGVSPHAPYTLSEKLLAGTADYALAKRLPLMLHAAESEAEDQLLKYGRGAFAESYARRGIEWYSPLMSPIQYLSTCGVLAAHPLLAHCVRVDEADIETIREARASVAHCPKSNLKLGHGYAPFTSMREIARGFGSDSVASNNTCDILEEARFATLLARHHGPDSVGSDTYTADDALRDATHGGARALGLGEQIGSLQDGAQADLIIVKLDGAHQIPIYDPARSLIFSSSGRDVLLTMVAGREVYSDGQVNTVDEARLRARMAEIGKKVTGDK